MTNEEINIAIAGACPDKFRNEDGLWFFQYATDCWSQCHNNSICNDLNAMHEAEESSTIFQSWRYTERWLDALEFSVIGRKAECRPDLSFVLRATASQRAEAFLRTIGRWEDGK